MADDRISQEVTLFSSKQPLYNRVQDEVNKLTEKLNEKGIQHILHTRVKTAKSLEKKLRMRQAKNEDSSLDHVMDLVGGRIVLWKHQDFPKIEALLRECFDIIQDPIQHPTLKEHILTQQERFRGYDGLHFRVRLKSADGEKSKVVIEIQVVHIVMSLFHDIEHKYGYKSKAVPKELQRALNILKGTANLTTSALGHIEEILENSHKNYINSDNGQTGNSFLKKPYNDLEDILAKNEIYVGPDQQNLQKWIGDLLKTISDIVECK
jgi:ppGpp synthetase/RelA/SpoT-type nucleotidyltranferase